MPIHDLTVRTAGSGLSTVVSAAGEIDAATVRRFAGVLSAVADEAEGSLLVDLEHVSFLDVKAFVVLLHASRKMHERGGEIVVACSRPATRRVLTILDPRGRLRLCP